MKRHYLVGSAFVVAALLLSGLPASADVKSPERFAPALDDGSWALTGSLSAPARSASSVAATLSGSIEVTQGVLDAAGCTSTAPQAMPFLLQKTGGSSMIAFSSVSAITSAGTASVSATATVPPGTYELIMRYRCGTSAAWSGQIAGTPTVTVSIASLSSTQNLTLACLASAGIPCPTTSTGALSVPAGTSVRFGVLTLFNWSDGVVTEERPTASQQLKYASSSGSYWFTESSNCDTTVSISSTYRWRCEVGGTVFAEVAVTRIEPTGTYVIGAPTANPSAGLSGTSVTVSATLGRQFTDGSVWPAPTGTSFTLEFQEQGGSFNWSQIGSSSTTTTVGALSRTFTLTKSGRVRFKVAGSPSSAVEVALLTRTGKFQVSDVAGPASAEPGSSVRITGKIKEELSNGSLAEAGNGVSVDLEFAIAYEPSASDLVWVKLSSTASSSGSLAATATAQYSGLWRFRKDDKVSQPVFVAVPGSTPITVTGSVEPIATEPPFVSTTTRFSIYASMSGYVGTETLQLYASVGNAAWVNVGSIGPGREIRGVYALPNPSQWGETAVSFQVRDPRQTTVGGGSAEEIFVDGIAGFQPRLTAPPRLYLPGETVRFTAAMLGITHLGLERPASWSGSAELQRFDGVAWRPVKVVISARGSKVTLDGEAVRDATYRVQSSMAQTASDPIPLRVTSGPPSLEVTWPDTVRIAKGLRVSAYVQLFEGERWRGTSQVQIQFRAPNASRWVVKSRKTLRAGRSVRLTAARPSSGCYRVIIPAFGIEDYAGYGVKSCRADRS